MNDRLALYFFAAFRRNSGYHFEEGNPMSEEELVDLLQVRCARR